MRLAAVMAVAVMGLAAGAKAWSQRPPASQAPMPAAEPVKETLSEDRGRPLATEEEKANFERTFGALIAGAKEGDVAKQKNLARILLRKSSDTEATSGTRRLAALKAIELYKLAGAAGAEMQQYVRMALPAFDWWYESSVQARLDLLITLRELGGTDPICSPDELAKGFVRLADLRNNLRGSTAALETLAHAEAWAKKDDETARIMMPRIMAARAPIERDAESDKALAKNPDDPAANEARGLRALAGPRPAEAGKYLAKANSADLRKLGAAIAALTPDVPTLKTLMDAATPCAAVLPRQAQAGLVNFVIAQCQKQQAKGLAANDDATLEAGRAALIDAVIKAQAAEARLSSKVVETLTLEKAAEASLFGLKGEDASRIVYVLDHSGSMIDTFDFLREEVKASVKRLKETQEFGVVMFSDNPELFSPGKCMPATAEQQKKAEEFLDRMRPSGRNDDLYDPFAKSITRAFEMKPTTIFFLTDGNFDPKVIELVKKLNPDGKVKVHTIAWIKVSDVAKESLQAIAEANGGSFKYVEERDLGK